MKRVKQMLNRAADALRSSGPETAWRGTTALFGLCWTALLLLLLFRNIDGVSRHTHQMLRGQASSLLQVVTLIRTWDKDLQGMQPRLLQEGDHSPSSPAGTPLSPAVMLSGVTGQLKFGEAGDFRIVSAVPSRALQRPDSWEAEGLKAFGKGLSEWHGLADQGKGGKVFRYLAPLKVELTCLTCHSGQDFRLGDLRGGVSISVPAGPYLESEGKEVAQLYQAYAFIWVLGLTGIALATRRLLGKTVEAKRVAAELKESEYRFRSLFEEAPVSYHEIDREGTVLRVNHAECELLGYAPEDIVGRPIWQFVSPEAQAQSRAAVQRKIAGEQQLQPFCREYTSREGKRLILEVHEKLIHEARGEVVGIRSSLLDVTERERAQQELKHRTEELIRSNAELEQFAYVASHDLQEPLRKVMAFGDRLRIRYGELLDEQGHDYLTRMRNAAARMQVLINDLLTLSRVKRKAQPFTKVALAKLAHEVVQDLETRVEQMGGSVELGELPEITADPLQMAQLLQNLIGNALKFHKPEEPPVVKVNSEVFHRTQRDATSNAPLGPQCRITVEDNGIGFEEQYVDKIFQVFQRLHGRNEYEGTGIGLAICRHIVERHRGSITAQSSPGHGARFIVTLPVEQEAEGASA